MRTMTRIQTQSSRALGAGVMALAVFAAGCADMSETQRGTAIGAGGGAAAGAVIGGVTGGRAGTGAVIGGVIGAVAGNVWSRRQEERRAQLEQQTRGTGVEVTRTADDRLKINVPNDISFDTGSAAVKPQLRSVLDAFANSLQGDPVANVLIVGHTDSTGSVALNDRLSLERADSVRDYLAGRGVSPTRVHPEGHGQREPIADNGSDAGRARNRRVEIFLGEPSPQG